MVVLIFGFCSIKAALLISKIEKKLHFSSELLFLFQILNIVVRIITLTLWITCFYFYFFQEIEISKGNYNMISSTFNKNLGVLTFLGFKYNELVTDSGIGENIYGVLINILGFIFSIFNGYNLVECLFTLKENTKNK
jgi:hypothetical protein